MADKLTCALQHLADCPRLFLACSGGRDSLALAYACYLLYQDGKLPALPTLLHVHHGIQSANDDWARHVHTWAMAHGFICHVLFVKLNKKDETCARNARYQAMMDKMNDGDVLLLAHHEGDQAETVLMRLIYGAGIQGLSGIKAWQDKTLNGKTIRLHRPWLSVSRKDITAFAKTHALPYVDDPTNDDTDNARNFIRNEILPKLHTLNPQASTNIARSAELLTQSHAILNPIITQALMSCLHHNMSDEPHQSVLDIGKLHTFDSHTQSAIIHTWLKSDEPTPPPSHLIAQIITLSHHSPDQRAQIFWQGRRGHVVCRHRQYLYRFYDKAWAFLQGQDSPLMLTVPADARLLSSTDKVLVPIHGMIRHLSGKKLYQTLGVAPFFRQHLHLIERTDGMWLIAPYQAWQLSGTARHHDGTRWQMR